MPPTIPAIQEARVLDADGQPPQVPRRAGFSNPHSRRTPVASGTSNGFEAGVIRRPRASIARIGHGSRTTSAGGRAWVGPLRPIPEERAATCPQRKERIDPRIPPGDSLRDDLADRLAVVDVEALAAGDFEPARVEAELVQDRGVDVGDVVAVLDGVEADLVGRAVDDAALDAAAGHPDREAVDVMVAAVAALRAGRAAELGGEDDERLVEQAALLQVLEQAGDRLVDLARSASRGSSFRPPWASQAPAPPCAVLDLDEAHAALDEPAGGEASACRTSRVAASVEAVERLRLGRLVGEVDDLGHRRLHAEGELVAT